ncbi:MAG: E3 binding domain-containing protein, partial [Dehalococcoidia bacterium]|nr:E3 binding domain-containing protein [Dehalococcoidia bacterium]
MAKEVTMPRLSDTMETGKVLKWLKQVGDEVKKGDILAEIETDKANMEMEAYESGVLTKIVVPEGGTAPIGETIAVIGDRSELTDRPSAPTTATPAAGGGGAAPSATRGEPTVSSAAPSSVAAPSAIASAADSSPGSGRIKASPLARRVAEELGVDLRAVTGTGPGGRIVRADVEGY